MTIFKRTQVDDMVRQMRARGALLARGIGYDGTAAGVAYTNVQAAIDALFAGGGGGGGGGGDVVGPASAVDGHVALFDGTTGKLIKDSGLTLSGTNTGDQTSVTGNAGTATALQTARTINGVAFDGTASITVTAAAGTLSGATLAAGVTASSLTSVGTLAALTVTAPIVGSVTGSSGSTTGNAATATALQTARAINGVNFDGTAAITVTAAAGTLSGATLAAGVTASSLTSFGAGIALGTPASGTLTNCTFPTLNQNTTGSAAKWTTARNLAGNSVDGSADVTFANKFIVQGTADTGLSAAQFLGALGTGILKNATTTGVLSIATGADLPAMTATVGGAVPTPPNNTTTFLRGDGTFAAPAGGSGTVTTVSVVSANGFAGTVANATTTPAITLTTTITGLLKGNATAISAATAGTDYSAGTSGLATGILKSTITTGALTIAVAGDFPTLNQNTSGSAATLTTARSIYGNNFDGSAALGQIIASTFGGTGNGFTKFSGPAAAEKTFTLPNASAVVLTDNAAVTVAQGGTGIASGTSGGIPYYSAGTTIASSGALSSNALVLGGGAGAAPKVATGLTTDGTSKLNLGVAGTSVGAVVLANATSGTITLQPVTGALGAVTLSVPAATATLATVSGALGTPTSVTLTNGTGLSAATGLVSTITTYTPTMSSGAGTITTTASKSGRYYQVGKLVFIEIKGTITTNGTGASWIQFTLPAAPGNVAASAYYGTGRATGVSGKQLQCQFAAGTQNVVVFNYDNTYPGANSEVIEISGFYEVA